MPSLEIAALYRGARIGGDFFDFVPVSSVGRLIVSMFDIAGRRDEALHIAAAVQDMLRSSVPQLFASTDLNECDAVTDLTLQINRTILDAAGGVRHAPAFLGCYNQQLGTLTYINAGHPAAVIKDASGITLLEANGLPLGLFSHAAHDALVSVLQPGAVLLFISRGLLETRSGREEFGMTRLKQIVATAPDAGATWWCEHILKSVDRFVAAAPRRFFNQRAGSNDVTALALVRSRV